MIVVGMDHFLSICKKKLVEWYNEAFDNMSVYVQEKIDLSNMKRDGMKGSKKWV